VLLNGGTTERFVDEHIVLRDIEKNDDAVWALLVHSGYLKPVSRREDEEGIFLHELAVPNQEVRTFFRNVIATWLKAAIGNRRLEELLRALTQGDVRTFGKLLGEMTAGILSYHDTGGERPERVYHAFVLGLLVNLGGRYRVESNRESGYGRHDVMLIPKDPSALGIILEFKKLDPDEDTSAEAALESAFRQIREKDYAAALRESGVERILAIAAVFAGKKVIVDGQEL